jgi:hypothetical protein
VTLEELEETTPTTANLTWPDFPEMRTGKPLGPLSLMGLDTTGEVLLWKEEVSADKVRSLLASTGATGYLTIVQDCLALYDVMTDDYVWLDSVTRPLDLHQPRIQRGHQVLERVRHFWFVDPSKPGGPVKTKPLPRPYVYETCWLNANGRPLFDVRALISFVHGHIGAIGDPYAWQTESEANALPPGIWPATMPRTDGMHVRRLTIKEDT